MYIAADLSATSIMTYSGRLCQQEIRPDRTRGAGGKKQGKSLPWRDARPASKSTYAQLPGGFRRQKRKKRKKAEFPYLKLTRKSAIIYTYVLTGPDCRRVERAAEYIRMKRYAKVLIISKS